MFDIDMLKIAEDYQHKNIRRAEVISCDDPMDLCRVQVKIFGLTDDVPPDSQPWIEMKFDGRFIHYPNPKDIIWIFLENGDIFRPVYMGTTYSPIGVNGNFELRYVQSDSNKVGDRFKGNVTHHPFKKLNPPDGKARDWWLETTLKSFKPSDDGGTGEPTTGIGSGGDEPIVKIQLPIDDGHYTTLEFDDHKDAERLQLMFLKGEGFLTFSKYHKGSNFKGVELYSNDVLNIETMNESGQPEPENRFRFQKGGLEIWSDKRHWFRSDEETDIQSGKHMHIECKSGLLNLQALAGGVFLRATGGLVGIAGSAGIELGPGSSSGNADTHSGEDRSGGLYLKPMLVGDGKQGKYFLYFEADNVTAAADKMQKFVAFFTWIKSAIEIIRTDAVAKAFFGQLASALGLPNLSSILSDYEDGFDVVMSLESQHLLEAWENIQVKATRD